MAAAVAAPRVKTITLGTDQCRYGLRKTNTYILKGLVYMVGNHTMTIEPGTVIRGSYSGTDVAALVITRGFQRSWRRNGQ